MAVRFGNLVIGKGVDISRQRADLLGRFPAHLRGEAERILNAAGLEQNDFYVDLVALAAASTSRLEQIQKRFARIVITTTSMVLSGIGLLLLWPKRATHEREVIERREIVYTALPSGITIGTMKNSDEKAICVPDGQFRRTLKVKGATVIVYSEPQP